MRYRRANKPVNVFALCKINFKWKGRYRQCGLKLKRCWCQTFHNSIHQLTEECLSTGECSSVSDVTGRTDVEEKRLFGVLFFNNYDMLLFSACRCDPQFK